MVGAALGELKHSPHLPSDVADITKMSPTSPRHAFCTYYIYKHCYFCTRCGCCVKLRAGCPPCPHLSTRASDSASSLIGVWKCKTSHLHRWANRPKLISHVVDRQVHHQSAPSDNHLLSASIPPWWWRVGWWRPGTKVSPPSRDEQLHLLTDMDVGWSVKIAVRTVHFTVSDCH